MCGPDITPNKTEFFKVGNEVIAVEYYDIYDDEHYGCIQIYHVNEEFYQDQETKDEIKKSKEIGSYAEGRPFVLDVLYFKRVLRGCIKQALYAKMSLKELPERKANSIIAEFMKILKW